MFPRTQPIFNACQTFDHSEITPMEENEVMNIHSRNVKLLWKFTPVFLDARMFLT